MIESKLAVRLNVHLFVCLPNGRVTDLQTTLFCVRGSVIDPIISMDSFYQSEATLFFVLLGEGYVPK